MASLIVETGISACLQLWGVIAPHVVNMVISCFGFTFGFSGNVESLQPKFKRLTDKETDVRNKLNDLENSRMVRKTEVAGWLHDVTKINLDFVNLRIDLLVQQNKFMNPLLRGGQVLKLISRFDVLLQQHEDFHESYVIEAENTRGKPWLTTSSFGDAYLENVKIIWNYVVIDKVRIIGIYGMGGVGKTTLAKHIHNLLLEKTSYHVYWVTVSREFSINKLQADIAKVIGSDISDENDEDKIAQSLKEALSKMKAFVLILDDVWDHIDLEKVGNLHHLEGCRLIITTRSLEVCRRICHEIIPVQPLFLEEAWNLFKKLLGQQTTFTRQVDKIAKDVVNECDGLPLGIAIMAGIMNGVTNIHVWENTLRELNESLLGKDEMEDKVFGVLKYSFDRLDPNYKRGDKRNGFTKLQLCFLYCSLYPEDHNIRKDELISRFISEKLMDQIKRRKKEFDLGHDILDKLVNVCLLESTRLNDGRDGVKMHDLVRDMAIKITRDNPKFKVLAGLSLYDFPNEEEYWTEDLEKMSLMHNYIGEIPEGMSPNCPKLSTLLLNYNRGLKFIPADSFFSLMCGLTILDLSYTGIIVLPNSVCDLESLNTLRVQHCYELVFVPNLGKLKALKELDLSSTKIEEVPQGIENLVNLKYLSLDGARCLKMIPKGLLPRFKYLQYLRLPLHVQMDVEEIESLKQLEKLSCRVEDVYDFNRIIRQSGERNITCFDIIISNSENQRHSQIPSALEIDCKCIIMSGCSLEEGEGNDLTLQTQDIEHLEFYNCEGLSNCFSDDLQRLGCTPSCIKTLQVKDCEEIEFIVNCEFNSLEQIHLEYLPNLMGVVDDVAVGLAPPPIDLFSSLKRLTIYQCHKIKKLGLGLLLDNLQNLETIDIQVCHEIEEIIQVVADEGRGGEIEEIIQDQVSLPKLKKLKLYDLPKLRSICDQEAKLCCNSIEEIYLRGCPKVKKLPLLFLRSSSVEDGQSSYSPPPNLKRIETEEKWWESLEWDHPTYKDILLPCLHFPIGYFYY